jgi:pimeloyl-ACP methyl ester carboxylesterase
MPHLQLSNNQVSLENLNVYYEVHGEGPIKIVFIGGMCIFHCFRPNQNVTFNFYISGFGNICHQWDLQVEYFTQFPEFSILIFDNRGSGFSSSPSGRYTTKQMAIDTLELLDHLRWERFHVVGLSMGGMVAQELAFLCGSGCRKRIASLTLESTVAYFNGLPVGYNLCGRVFLILLDLLVISLLDECRATLTITWCLVDHSSRR